MIYYFSLTEHQSLHADCVNHGNNQTHALYPNSHSRTDLVIHDHVKNQGVTNGHCSQYVIFWYCKNKEEVDLTHSFRVRDDVLLCYKVHQHFGDSDGGMAEVNEWQPAEEIVNWGMQIGTEPNQSDDARFPPLWTYRYSWRGGRVTAEAVVYLRAQQG
jgi:hypothetical protein